MALIGSLLDFTATDVLQLVKMQRKDGMLEVYSRDETVTVWFRNGDMVWAESSLRSPAPRICKWLLRKGALSEGHLSRVQMRVEEGEPLDKVLAEEGRVPPETWKPLVEHYMKETVYSLFRWLEGDYTFEADVPLNVPFSDPPRPINTDDVLMDTAVRSDEWPYIQDRVPSVIIVFGHADGAAVADSAPEEERYVFGRVNGENNVEMIVDHSPHGAFETLRALANLVEQKLVVKVGEYDPRADALNQEREEAARREQSGKSKAREVVPGRRESSLLALACTTLMVGCGWLFYANATEPPVETRSGISVSVAAQKEYKVRKALGAFRLLTGRYPETIGALQLEGLLPESMDMEGLVYEPHENGFSLHAG